MQHYKFGNNGLIWYTVTLWMTSNSSFPLSTVTPALCLCLCVNVCDTVDVDSVIVKGGEQKHTLWNAEFISKQLYNPLNAWYSLQH